METQVRGAVTFRGAPPRPAEGFTPQQTAQLFQAAADVPPPSKPSPPKRLLLLVVGFLILLLAVIMPIWDAFLLEQEPTYNLMHGKLWATWTIVSCFIAAPIYAIMLVLWFKCSRVEFITEQTLLMIFVLVSSALGLSLLFASQPLFDHATAVYDNIFFNCADGAYTRGIYQHSVALHKLRADPTCAAKDSVEQCSGFEDKHPEYTDYLRKLENSFKCVGFCTTPEPVDMPQPSLIQMDHVARGELSTQLQAVFGTQLARLQQRGQQALRSSLVSDAGEGASKVDAAADVAGEARSQRSDLPGAVRTNRVPPLFFPVAMERNPSSCDGAAARSMKYRVTATGKLLFIEGMALLIASVVGTLLKVFGFISEGYTDEPYYINNPAKLRQAGEVML